MTVFSRQVSTVVDIGRLGTVNSQSIIVKRELASLKLVDIKLLMISA